jgi:hypothetical protein
MDMIPPSRCQGNQKGASRCEDGALRAGRGTDEQSRLLVYDRRSLRRPALRHPVLQVSLQRGSAGAAHLPF